MSTSTATDPDSEESIGNTGRVDHAVTDIFATMLGLSCAVAHDSHDRHYRQTAAINISATILFSGWMEGDCVLQMPPSAARRLTGALLGAEGAWGDEMLDDAVGELCNMVAGRWKSSLGLAARCHLSAPAVSRGVARESLDLESLGRITMRRVYRFDDSAFELKLTVR